MTRSSASNILGGVTEERMRSYLEELLERMRVNMRSYRDFLHFLAISSHPHRFNHVYAYDVLRIIEDLIKMITRASDTLTSMRHYAGKLVRKGYKPFLVDCLGLPEVYEIYIMVSEECGVLATSVKPYINSSGTTQKFKEIHGTQSMADLAKILGTSIYKSIDRKVHEELSVPMELDDLLDLAEKKLRSIARSLARDAKEHKRSIIISDHGYDICCDASNKYYLDHGVDNKLAKLAPLIIIECV